MSIRLRLRSSNATPNHSEPVKNETSNLFNDNDLKSFPESYMQNECNICGKQKDINEEHHWFISCSICTVQYHLRCLEISSILLQNNKSRAYKTWTCKECKRCWFCKNKRFDKSHLMSSLRSHPERDLNTLEMIICKQCDSSIHTLCFYKYLKNLPLKIRELRRRKKNFVCQSCENELKNKMKSGKVNGISNGKNSKDDLNDYKNVSSKKDSNNNILNNTKQLHIQLKKLGITNVESMINNIDDNDNTRSTRSRKNANESPNILGNLLPIKNDTNSLTNLDIDDSSLQTFVNKKRKIINSHYNADKVSNKRSLTSKAVNLERNCTDTNIDLENQNSPIKIHCSVPGCNSEGHLSGKYNYHSLVETCQIFHNQTMEECIDRYNKRKMKNSKLQSPRRFSTRKHRKSPKWDEIINERNLFNCTDPILNVTSK